MDENTTPIEASSETDEVLQNVTANLSVTDINNLITFVTAGAKSMTLDRSLEQDIAYKTAALDLLKKILPANPPA